MDFPRGDLMFRPVMTKTGKPVEFHFEDEIITAIDGDNVASALLKADSTQSSGNSSTPITTGN